MRETFINIFLLSAAVIWNNGLAQNAITCNAGTAFTGEMSSVTCYFHTDIKANKISISISMMSSSPGGEERDVLQCSWKQQSNRPECIMAEGYTFNYEVTDRLTVNINSTTHDHAGVYSCHMVPPNGAKVEQCTLLVKEKVTGKPISTRKSATLPHPQASSEGQNEILIAILVLLVILILLVIGAITAYVLNKKKTFSKVMSRLRRTRRKGEDDTEQDDSENKPQKKAKGPRAECEKRDSTGLMTEKQTQEQGQPSRGAKKPLLSDTPKENDPPPPPSPKPPARRGKPTVHVGTQHEGDKERSASKVCVHVLEEDREKPFPFLERGKTNTEITV